MSDAQGTQGPRNSGMQIQIWIMLIMVGGVMLAGTLMQPQSEVICWNTYIAATQKQTSESRTENSVILIWIQKR